MQVWYVDNTAISGKLQMIATAVCIIIEKVPEQGYYMEPEKSLLICKASVTEVELRVL